MIYNKTFRFIFDKSGSHLLSHAVSSIVPSAAYVLTVVFGMGTGVSRKRIATRKFVDVFLYSVMRHPPLPSVMLRITSCSVVRPMPETICPHLLVPARHLFPYALCRMTP